MSLTTSTDIAYALQDCGTACSCGGVATYGVVDSADEVVLERGGVGGSVSKMIHLTIRSAAWPTVAVGSTVTISGTSYTVRERLAMDDGELTRLALQRR